MKKSFWNKILLSLMSFVLVLACNNEDISYVDPAEGIGSLSFEKLKVDVDTEEITKSLTVNVDTFLVQVMDKSTNKMAGEWTYGEMPQVVTLPVGTYSLNVVSHEVTPADFNAPYYASSQDFVIEEGKVTDLDAVTCVFSNVRVSIGYDPALAALLGDDVQVTVSLGDGVLVFVKDEQRSGYFMPNQQSNILTAELAGTIDGEKMTVPVIFSDVEAGQHRKVTFSVKDTSGPVQEGDMGVSIKIDASCTVYDQDIVVDVEEGIIDDEEPEVPEPGAPTIVGEGFDIDQVQMVPAEGANIVVIIAAEKGIKNLFVEIDSETLTSDLLESVGLAKSFDLANPGDLAAGLSSLGFPVGDEVVGQKTIRFDLTQFTPLLNLEGPPNHNFHIRVTDQGTPMGETSKTLKLQSEQ